MKSNLRRLLWIGVVTVMATSALTSAPAAAAPKPGFFVPFARTIVGDTMEIWRSGGRVGVKLIGINAPRGNTVCGRAATAKLDALASGGLRFIRDANLRVNRRFLHWFYARTPDGRSVAMQMVRSGMAHAVWQGKEKQKLALAEARAQAAGRGCLWGGGSSAATTISGGSSGAAGAREGASAPSFAPAASTAGLPTGFSEEVVAGNLDLPTGFAFLPDGRIAIALKGGVVRLVNASGQLVSTPVIDISSEVNDYWDHGLIGIAADPQFSTNGFLYLYYTYENNASQYEGSKTARLTRVTMSGNTASPGTETTILGSQVGSSCFNFPVGADCIPTDSAGHSTGAIHFASDGTMFVTVGDGASWGGVDDNALRAQNLDWLAGKLLHVTKTGQGLAANPFWNGNANANRSKIYAYGLRNAYRFNLRPGSNTPYIGDVGWYTWEEVSVASSGANLGWPCYEATAKSNYQTKPECAALYAQGSGAVKAPLIKYCHCHLSSAVTAGPFYTGTEYPATYQGAYFYGDYAQGWIRYLHVNASNGLVDGPFDFHTQAGSPTDIEMGPDGNLYYVSIYPGELRKICFNNSCGTPPPPPPTGEYDSEVLSDSPLGYWRLGETSGSTAADASGNGHPGTYVNAPGLGSASLLSSDSNPSVSLNGTDEYVEVPDAPVWNLTGDLSLEALVNVTGGGTYRTIVAKHLASGNVPTFEFRIVQSTGKLQFVQKTTAGTFMTATSASVLATGTTYHVAVTKSGSTVRLYINGVLDKTVTFNGTVASNTRPVRIGMRDGTYPLGGRLDEVAVYDHALSSARVAAHETAATSAGNSAPAPQITAPSASLTYKVGDVITYSGSATDPEDGTIPGASLDWDIRLHHCPFGSCHLHPYLSDTGTGGSFTVPDHGDDIYFELILTATDSGGKTGSTSVSIYPKTSTTTIQSSPTGRTVFYDGFSGTAPMVIESVVGSTHTIDVPSPQGGYTFSSWSDGGAQSHTITTTATDATYTVTFTTGGTTTYNAEVQADNPLGYWRLGESSGPTAADSSGNGHPGTYVNGPALGQPGLLVGDANTSVGFDGTNDDVEIPDAAIWNLTGNLTIEALINVTGGANYRTIVAKHDATGDVPTFEFRVEQSTGKLQFVQKTTGGVFLTASSPTGLSAGTHHVAVTKSGSTVKLFVDGALVRTSTFTGAIATNTRPVRIGMRDGTKPFGGRIDEVAIYDHAVSDARIQAHASAAGF